MIALVVDDDRILADVVAFTLRREGFEVVRAFDGETAWQTWLDVQPDLVVLDVNLPKIDGFTLCRRIRAQADTPILLLTVRDEEDDIVQGLKLGADDYITKPFSPRQLIARAQAILRRSGKLIPPQNRMVGSLTFDPNRREIRLGSGQAVALTPLETRLLDCLILNAGHVLTAEAIIDQVWGPRGGDRDMLRQLIHRLRGKLDEARLADTQPLTAADSPDASLRIETIPGVGYGLITERAD
jgi:DNA-binding response OmpR family regulator